jgi:hypothetical protein
VQALPGMTGIFRHQPMVKNSGPGQVITKIGAMPFLQPGSFNPGRKEKVLSHKVKKNKKHIAKIAKLSNSVIASVPSFLPVIRSFSEE